MTDRHFSKTVTGKDIKFELNERETESRTASGQINNHSIIFENRIWTLFAKMGFTELNQGHDFQFALKDGTIIRLFDIFARDEESVIFAKCIDENSIDAGNIDKILRNFDGTLLQEVYRIVKTRYKRKLKIKFNIFLNGIKLKPGYTDQFTKNFMIFESEQINYFFEIAEYLKSSARYQFLSLIFSDQKIDELTKSVFATKGKLGNEIFYTFLISPTELMRISYVAHKSLDISNAKNAYQRMLKKEKLISIGKFINKGGVFPSNIVVNFKTNKSPLRFDIKEKIDKDISQGTLQLPSNYGSAWIIDGQHRLYGYTYAKQSSDSFKNDKSVIQVMAFDNMSKEKEMNMFVDLNSKQVKIPPNILVELYADLHWKSDDNKLAFQSLISRLILKLNSEENSPLYNRMITSTTKRDTARTIGLQSMNYGLRASKLIGYSSGGRILPGPFCTRNIMDYPGNLQKSYEILSEILNVMKVNLKEQWHPITKKDFSYFCNNVGIRALLLTLFDIADHLQKYNDNNLNCLEVKSIIEYYKPFLKTITDYFTTTEREELELKWKKAGSSSAMITEHSRELGIVLHQKHDKFKPIWLDDYEAKKNEALQSESHKLVGHIERRLFEFTMSKLKIHYGENIDDWFGKGIPESVRLKCAERYEKEGRERKQETYIDLIDYKKIFEVNWTLFQNDIPLDLSSGDRKQDRTKWIIRINNIRNIISHHIRDDVTHDDLVFLRKVWDTVKESLIATHT